MKENGLPMGRELPGTRDVTTRAEEERASMEVKALIFHAMKNPRDEERGMREIERVAKIPEFAEKAYYSYPRSKTEIFGPSIHLADEFKRIWGNIVTKQTIVHEDDDSFVIEVMAWDLQTNVASGRQAVIKNLIQRKDASGRTQWIRPDERDKRELIERHHSLLRRNCILGLLPRWFVDKVVRISRDTMKKRAGKVNIEELRKKVELDFEAMGIYREQIESYIGHSLSATTVEEIAELQGIIQSIRDGAARKEEYFGQGPGQQPKPRPAEKEDITLDQVLNGDVEPEPPQVPEEKPPEKPQERLGLGDERIMDEFNKRMLACNTAIDVQKYMKEVRAAAPAMRISKVLLEKMSSVANDRMRDLLKKGQ